MSGRQDWLCVEEPGSSLNTDCWTVEDDVNEADNAQVSSLLPASPEVIGSCSCLMTSDVKAAAAALGHKLLWMDAIPMVFVRSTSGTEDGMTLTSVAGAVWGSVMGDGTGLQTCSLSLHGSSTGGSASSAVDTLTSSLMAGVRHGGSRALSPSPPSSGLSVFWSPSTMAAAAGWRNDSTNVKAAQASLSRSAGTSSASKIIVCAGRDGRRISCAGSVSASSTLMRCSEA
jgi:hypothetical protein